MIFAVFSFVLESFAKSKALTGTLQTFTIVIILATWLAGAKGGKVKYSPLHSFSGALCPRSTSQNTSLWGSLGALFIF